MPTNNRPIDVSDELKPIVKHLAEVLQLMQEDWVIVHQPDLDREIKQIRLNLKEIRRIAMRTMPKELKDELREQSNTDTKAIPSHYVGPKRTFTRE